MEQSISMGETQFQHHNKQTQCMNQRTQNAITIAAQHKDSDLVEVELAFCQAEMGVARVDHTLSQDDSNSIELQELKFGLLQRRITTKT